MINEDKKFEVREYDQFPFKKDNDEVVKVFDTFEEAKFESRWLNRKAKMGERYYVMDNPHEWVELTSKQREMLFNKYGLK